MTALDIPPINATLNGLATLLISGGFIAIKVAKNPTIHRAFMLTAALVSALFLVGYLTYHGMQRGFHTPFGGTGAIRALYLTILWTHIPLAGLIAYLVPRTFSFALKGQFDRHRAWARWTFPIWFYVSVTGVLVYFFLYVWWPSSPRG